MPTAVRQLVSEVRHKADEIASLFYNSRRFLLSHPSKLLLGVSFQSRANSREIRFPIYEVWDITRFAVCNTPQQKTHDAAQVEVWRWPQAHLRLDA